MFAAEVRCRAADDLSFLLPADDTVKLAGIGYQDHARLDA
jgi:hypothetical protein